MVDNNVSRLTRLWVAFGNKYLSSRHESHDSHISSGTLDYFLLMAFHTLSLLLFPLLHFPPLQSAPAFSAPAIMPVPHFSLLHFPLPHFQRRRFCRVWHAVWYRSFLVSVSCNEYDILYFRPGLWYRLSVPISGSCVMAGHYFVILAQKQLQHRRRSRITRGGSRRTF